jgi:hypothetical protein
MKEKIHYQTEEGQNFQETPHVALLLSSQVPDKWQVDLRWREDDDPVNLDAEHYLEKGLSLAEAIIEAKKWGELLNIPVAKYEDNRIEILINPESQSTKDQKINLELIKLSPKTKKFPTH